MTAFQETKQRLTELLGDGRWRSSAELWRETKSEPKWTRLALSSMQERREVEYRARPSGEIEYRLAQD
jgi:hypothetical protein